MMSLHASSLLLLAGCASADLNFLVMGDWGGIPIWPYYTPAQSETARSMGEEAAKTNASYALALGDNFYETGIGGDAHDSRFKHTFEDVFTAPSLGGEDFFRVVAGNHDHKGNVTAQIAYSELRSNWHFPSQYYTWTDTVDADGTTLQVVLIDTVVLSGNSVDAAGRELQGHEMPGPADTLAAESQMAWLNETLSASTADYIIVAGHYPIWSVCEHGPNTGLIQTLKPLLEEHGVSAYMCGHDHCEEHIDDGGGVQYHVIGAANQNQGCKKNEDKVPSDQVKFLDIGEGIIRHEFMGGFASVRANSTGLVVEHFRSLSGKYTSMYVAEPILPRAKRQ